MFVALSTVALGFSIGVFGTVGTVVTFVPVFVLAIVVGAVLWLWGGVVLRGVFWGCC